MADRLRLPTALAATALGLAVVAAGCPGGGDDDPAPDDSDGAHYFCIPDELYPDAAPGGPDAGVCDQTVENPEDCPEGCRPVG